MKTYRKLLVSICSLVIALAILFAPLGLFGGGPTVAHANGGVAQLKIITKAPVIRVLVSGINQNDEIKEWNKVYSPAQDEPIITTDWWWRFKWFFPGFPDPKTLGPYVWVWYENGSRDNMLCSKSDINVFSNEVSCEFPEPPVVVVPPPLNTTCDPVIYNGILHCTKDNFQIIKVNPRAARFETVLAKGKDGECRDVNLPLYSTGVGCIKNGLYPRDYVETMAVNYSNAVVAFNTDLFGDDGSHGPEGLTVKNGIRLDGQDCEPNILIDPCHDYNEVNRPSLSISSNGGDVRIGAVNSNSLPDPLKPWNWDPDPNAYWTTVGGTVILVQNSNNVVETECNLGGACPSKNLNRARTAIGKSRNGELIIVAIDEAHGVTLDELAQTMIDLGAVLAINLDGGTSTQLWYDNRYLVNPNGPVANALLVFPEPPTSHSSSQTIHILPGETKTLIAEVLPAQAVATSNATWQGSDVVMSLISPSGRVIERDTIAQDVAHDIGHAFETYSLLNPESGIWEVNLYGADLPPEGEDVTFTFTTGDEAPIPQLAYLDGDKLVLNMGSADRREARNIQPDEINEEFLVIQLGADKFAVSAFGLTQVYTGATQIQADGDDGDDIITLEAGDVPFTAPTDINGGSGDDQIQSGDGADTLAGGAGNDKISGAGGNDSIKGDDGDDELNGQAGQDTVNGGAGSDIITGGGDADILHGDDGDDKIQGEDGADQVYGDAGADTLSGGADDDSMNGGAGNDSMEGNDGADTMRGDGGNDQMLGQAGADVMFGDAGDDTMDGGAGTDLMEGNDDADTMRGGSENDKMYGNPGPDTMFGDAGLDTMYGNTGNDAMRGGGDDDYMEGNQDDDSMYGDDGQDDMIGGSPIAGTSDGGDMISGGPGQDVMLGDNGTITRPGGVNAYDDSVRRDVVLFDVQTTNVSASADVSGNDSMTGDDGDDLAFGQGGNDSISGGAGNDSLEGNAGSDRVNGDADQDDIIGGGSANDGVIDADRIGEGLLDAGDELHGGDNGDVMTGDNARITRPVDGDGRWLIDPNTGEPVRQVVLFDIEILGGKAINPLTSGSDRMFGDAGKDKMFGQGNGQATDAIGMDPLDGVDNDRNGRESGASDSFDCLDGRDNDADGVIDAADPQCIAAIDNNPGGDEMHGGADFDYMEGNHGSDWMFGDDGEDDIIGGSSAGDGVIGGAVMPTGLKDGNDAINSNGEDDVLVGDNAQIVRPNDANGVNKRLTGGLFDLAIRDVRMATTPEPVGAFGNDWMSAGAGVDDIYGQLGNDYMEGNDGEDAMVGDLGKIINNLMGINDGIPDPDVQQLIAPNAPFFDPGELIYQNGSLYRSVELYSFLSNGGGAGNDTMYGGADSDAIHGGAGDDIINGNSSDDRLFGGDDSDAIWGGPDHDILFGGYGIDYLDVLPRLARADKKDSFLADPSTWFEAARVDNYQGLDIMYGGWDRDWMQADVSAPGRVNGDRMLDWAGAFNAFYRCDAAYGAWVITRQHSPSVVTFLQELAQGFGAFDTSTPGTSGFRETAIVFPQEIKFNSNPPNPDNPAHFTCGPAK